MREADKRKLAEMKARGEGEESMFAYFKMMGYTEQEVLDEIGRVMPAEPAAEEAKGIELARISTKKGPSFHIALAAVMVLALLALAGYVALPYLPSPEPGGPAKTSWKVSSTVVSCAPSGASLKVTNADIAGMPVTEFHVRENGAVCAPPTDLQSSGIGQEIACPGEFVEGSVYTLVSDNTLDDGFVCLYQ